MVINGCASSLASSPDERFSVSLPRQGEWLFLPRPWLRVPEKFIERDAIVGDDRVCEMSFRGVDDRLFVQGAVYRGGDDAILLPFWHRVVVLED